MQTAARTTELPPELRSWEPYLDFLTFHLREDVARLAGVLNRHLGQRPGRFSAAGEPSGWSGLANRGPFDRLIESEWALADEVPDEFLRRAAQGELLYLNPSKEAGAQGGVLRVLFDAGPEQLGACRVVQLVLLVVFSRRAAEQGMQLIWTLAQTGQSFDLALSPVALENFLQGRSLEVLSDEHILQFVESAQTRDELWTVGCPPPTGGKLTSVVLEQNGPTSVRLQCGSVEVCLELPSIHVSAQLLRNPFRALDRVAQLRPSFQYCGAGIDLAFCQNGRKLRARAERWMMIYPIPNSPRDLPGKVRPYLLLYPGPLVAMGEVGKALWVVQRVETDVPGGVLWRAYGLNPADTYEPNSIDFQEPKITPQAPGFRSHTQATLPAGCCWKQGDDFWIQEGDCLWKSKAIVGDAGVLQLQDSSQTFLARGTKSLLVRGNQVYRCNGETVPCQTLPLESQRVILGSSPFPGPNRLMMTAAVQISEDTWQVSWKETVSVFKAPPGQVVGAMATGQGAILVIKQDRHIQIINHQGAVTSVNFDSALEEVVLSPYPNGQLAYRTANREIGVYCTYAQEFLLRVLP